MVRREIIFVGTLAQLYKAPDVLIDAFAICQAHIDAELVIVGCKRMRGRIRDRACATTPVSTCAACLRNALLEHRPARRSVRGSSAENRDEWFS